MKNGPMPTEAQLKKKDEIVERLEPFAMALMENPCGWADSAEEFVLIYPVIMATLSIIEEILEEQKLMRVQ